MKSNINGILNVYKPTGISSFQVISTLKKALKVKKMGHTGTLDPKAEGLLVICIGEATKIANYIMHAKKRYKAEILFGIETDTQDMEGKILRENECKNLKDKIRRAIPKFIGEIEQIPPMYSAISYKGKRLYELAREGKTVERKHRKVIIYKFEFLDYREKDYPIGTFFIECSKGTYIRSLAYDLGREIGCPAVLYSLTREGVGDFSLDQAYTIEEIRKLYKDDKLEEIIIDIKNALPHFIHIDITSDEELRIRRGQFIQLSRNFKSNRGMALALNKDRPVAIGEIREKGNLYFFYPKRVFHI